MKKKTSIPMEQLTLPLEEAIALKRVFYGPVFPCLENALKSAVREIKAEDPLKPVVLVVPSMVLGEYLRRRIPGGGIYFYNFKNFAEKISGSYFQEKGMTPVPFRGEEVLARKALEDVIKPGDPLAKFTGSPGFTRLFMALLKDFRQGAFDRFPDIPDLVGKMKLESARRGEDLDEERYNIVFKLLHRFREGFREKYYDMEDLIIQGAGYGGEFGGIFNTDQLLLYGFYEFDQAQRMLIGRLARQVNITTFLPWLQGNHLAEESLEWLKGKGFSPTECSSDTPIGNTGETQGKTNLDRIKVLFGSDRNTNEKFGEDDSFRIFSCPDDFEEARETARMILKTAREGIPFENMAVALKNPNRYGPMFREVFESTGIPYYYHNGYPANQTPQGKCLKLLLDLAGSNLPRFAVMEFCSSGMVNFENLLPDENPPATALWDRISREAGIRKNFRSWQKGLERYKNRREKRLERQTETKEKSALKKDIAETERLQSFISLLNNDLSAFSRRDTWSSFIDLLTAMFRRYIIPGPAMDCIIADLQSLKTLEDLQDKVTFSDFRSSVRELLQSGRIRAGSFMGGCVHIFDMRTIPGMSFDLVFIPGMSAGEIPSRSPENPLMPDSHREIFNRLFQWEGALPLRGGQVYHDPILIYMLLFGCKRTLTFSFPRSQPGQESPNVPSPYLLDYGRLLTGGEIFYRDMDKIPGFTFIPKRFSRIFTPNEALDEAEYMENIVKEASGNENKPVIAAVSGSCPPLSGALDYYRIRRNQKEFTPWDGVIKSPPLLEKLRNWLRIHRPHTSPTNVEGYFRCPYQFFVSRMLGLKKTEAPEDIEVISGLDRGSLYHEIFFHFYMKLKEQDLIPLQREKRETYLEIIGDIARGLIQGAEDQGLTGAFLAWFQEQVDIMDSVNRFVDVEIDYSGVPSHFEVTFGQSAKALEGSDSPRGTTIEEPGEINLGDGKVYRYRGRIDRIDGDNESGGFAVIDYKSGKPDKYKTDRLQGGERLQLPLYVQSVRQLLPETDPEQPGCGIYYFATQRGGFKKVKFSSEAMQEKEDEMKELLNAALEEPANGLFIPYPGGKKDNCQICDFNTVCPVDMDRLFRYKQTDPKANRFLKLKEIE